jgi:hypothetical protein
MNAMITLMIAIALAAFEYPIPVGFPRPARPAIETIAAPLTAQVGIS